MPNPSVPTVDFVVVRNECITKVYSIQTVRVQSFRIQIVLFRKKGHDGFAPRTGHAEEVATANAEDARESLHLQSLGFPDSFAHVLFAWATRRGTEQDAPRAQSVSGAPRMGCNMLSRAPPQELLFSRNRESRTRNSETGPRMDRCGALKT